MVIISLLRLPLLPSITVNKPKHEKAARHDGFCRRRRKNKNKKKDTDTGSIHLKKTNEGLEILFFMIGGYISHFLFLFFIK
jgi:hypothetical protein